MTLNESKLLILRETRSSSTVASGLIVDRISDASVATRLISKIMKWPRAAENSDCAWDCLSLERGTGKLSHTAVIFVTTGGENAFRLEAGFDKLGEREYQLGDSKLFHDNQRNKRMEVAMIDVEM